MVLIKLTRNKAAIVDEEDYERVVAQGKWTVGNCRSNPKFYAQRCIYIEGKKSTMKMHRFIISCPKNMCVDHINGDTLDNRKSNLRIVSHKDNSRNRAHQKTAAFPYKGIAYYKYCKSRPWAARITCNGKTLFIGSYSSMEEAALAYNYKAVELFGIYAKLNDVILKKKEL